MDAKEINHSPPDYFSDAKCANQPPRAPKAPTPADIQKFLTSAGRFLLDEFSNHPRLRDLGFECERQGKIDQRNGTAENATTAQNAEPQSPGRPTAGESTGSTDTPGDTRRGRRKHGRLI